MKKGETYAEMILRLKQDSEKYIAYRKRITEHRNKYRRESRQKAINILGGKCVVCGITDVRVLQIDHINGGGWIDINKRKGSYYRRVVESVKNKENKYQLLCANHNWIKKWDNDEKGYKYR